MKPSLYLLLPLLLILPALATGQIREEGSLRGFSVGINGAHGTFLARGNAAVPEIFIVGRRDENRMKVGHSQVGLNLMYGFRDDLAVYLTGTWGFFQESLDSQGATFNRDIGLQYNYFGLYDSDILLSLIPYVRAGYSSMMMQSIYLRNIERNTAFVSPYNGGGFHLAVGVEYPFWDDYFALSMDYMIKRVNLKPDREVSQPFPNTPWNYGLMFGVRVNFTNYYYN